jgi:hypothetical protein
MSHYHSQQEIDMLSREVQERIAAYNFSSAQWQQGIREKHERRIHEIIVEVVRNYYGYIVQEVVRYLRSLFSV